QVARYVDEYPPKPQGWGDPRLPQSEWAPIGSVTMLVLILLTTWWVVRRWSLAGRPARRQYALVWMAVVGMAVVGSVYTLAALVNASVVVQRYLLLAHAVGLIVMPAAIAVGLLRVRMARL